MFESRDVDFIGRMSDDKMIKSRGNDTKSIKNQINTEIYRVIPSIFFPLYSFIKKTL